jgi:type III restriction enzyme
MKLQFKIQDFQLQAVKAVVDCFQGQPLKSNKFTLERSKDIIRKAKAAASGLDAQTSAFETDVLEDIGYRNSSLHLVDTQVLKNIQEIQEANEIHQSQNIERPTGWRNGYNLTVEMETGTGKTYTYIRTMYELHKHYGWSKFIIIVPSIAIREGVYKTFEDTQEHFLEEYGHKISPFIYNSSKPQDIESFASDSRISVMIINTQAFAARGEDSRRIRQELDQFGTRRPIDIIAETNPIIIIDEPQSVDGPTTLASMQEFKPLFTLRYSATHRIEYNKVFRLDALDAYNKKLVKKIQVKGISIKGYTGLDGYVYLEQIKLSTTKPPVAVIEINKLQGDNVVRKIVTVEQGASLYTLSGELEAYKNQLVTIIDGQRNCIEINGNVIEAGTVINNEDELIFRRIQIRETILSHIQKEKVLFDKGIKVLSLFFIDSVENYRKYNEQGDELQGEFAKIFEEEYKKIIAENGQLSLLEGEFLNGISEEYAAYLKRDVASNVHQGYFSIDKKGKAIDSTVKRGSEDSDDISAYDLIMKNKQRLLDFDEPTRFIFSHSALKEGWDNPNVFQICALKNADAANQTRRRQEVGRGMRLCVNQNGMRQDFDTIGEEVHEINKLTVIASESYESFAKGLQSEIAATLKERPQKATIEFFVGKMITNEQGDKYRITEYDARKINKILYKNDIIDDDDKLTSEGKELVELNNVSVPDHLEQYKDSIIKILQSIYTGEGIKPENERQQIVLKTNANFDKQEFQELWKKISYKSIYEVKFDTPKLIEECKNKINSELNIVNRTYEVRSGELKEATKQELIDGTAMEVAKSESFEIKVLNETNTVYDIIGEIEQLTNLTRRTIVEILKSIKEEKFLLIQKNPEEFIAKVSSIIKEAMASLILNNITYHKLDECHESSTVFSNDKTILRDAPLMKKHIYDYLTTDSVIESEFAKELEIRSEVIVYSKLPRSFHIATPIANYSPDWAIVFDKDQVKHIYFVAETKGSDSSADIREIEKLKIHCATKHFEAITGSEVKFKQVSSYGKLLEVLNK